MKKLFFTLLWLATCTMVAIPVPKLSFRNNPYATHQPILYELVKKTSGPIIEFGCGDGSTDLLHALCKETKRTLITLEDDLTWFNKYKNKYLGDGHTADNSGWHKFYFVPGKSSADHGGSPDHWIRFFNENAWLKDGSFDICFIDQSPWLARYETLKFMKNKAIYLMLHDCDYFPNNGIFQFHEECRFFKVYYPPYPWPAPTGPPTLVASRYDLNFPDIDYTKF